MADAGVNLRLQANERGCRGPETANRGEEGWSRRFDEGAGGWGGERELLVRAGDGGLSGRMDGWVAGWRAAG